MKKFFTTLILVLITTTTWAYDVEVDGIYYNLNSSTESTACVTYKDNNFKSYSGVVIIPSSIEYNSTTYSVVSVGDSAFYDCTELTSITFPETLTDIGSRSFSKCTSLTQITINEHVNTIGNAAFGGCTSLTTLNYNAIDASLPTGVLNKAFPSCITTISLGNTVKAIPNQIAYGCSGLKSIKIPDSVKSIESYAFCGCTGLCSINFPESVIYIEPYAFYGCEGLTSISIPNSVTKISNSVFGYCSSLKSVVIGKSLKSIGDFVFYGCSELTSIDVGNSVDSIGKHAFYECNALDYVNIHDLSAWCNIKFVNWSSNPIDYAHRLYLNNTEIKDLIIPNDVTSIGSYAFENCKGLTSVTIPESITSINEKSFYNCDSLKKVFNLSKLSISKGSQGNGYVGYYAKGIFTDTNLTFSTINGYEFCSDSNGKNILWDYTGTMNELTLPESFFGKNYAIGESVFKGLSNLTSVIIPNSVTTIGSSSFYGCTGLTSLTIPNTVTIIKPQAFRNCTNLISVNLGNSVTTIGGQSFYGCTKLSSVAIPNCVITIGGEAFRGCTDLKCVNIGNSVTDIGDGVFRECTNLISLIIPDSVKCIGGMCFYDSSIESLTIGCSVDTIGSSVFPSTLRNLYFKDSDKSLKTFYLSYDNYNKYYKAVSIFGNLTELETLYIGRNLVSTCKINNSYYSIYPLKGVKLKNIEIGGNCKNICNNLARESEIGNLIFHEGLDSIGDYCFCSCGLKKVVLPNSNTYIGVSAFANNELENIELGDSLSTIDEGAFAGYKNKFNNITLPTSIKKIGYNAFSGCKSLKHIYVKKGEYNPSRYDSQNCITFYGCDSLESVEIPATIGQLTNGCFARLKNLKDVHFCDSKFELYFPPDGSYSTNTTFYGDHLDTVYIGRNLKYQRGNGNGTPFLDVTLKKVKFGGNATMVYDYMFHDNDSLRNVDFGDVITNINKEAFYKCNNLKNVIIPNSVVSLDTYAFGLCDSLESVDVLSSTPPYVSSLSFPSTTIVYVPRRSINEYRQHKTWSTYIIATREMTACSIEIEVTEAKSLKEGLKEKGVQNVDIAELRIRGNLSNSDWTFLKDSLNGVNILDISGISNTSIPDNQFENNIYLNTCKLPSTIKNVGSYAFYGTKNLRGLFEFGYTCKIGDYAFDHSAIDSLYLSPSSGYVSLGMNAFNCCTNLKYTKAGINCTLGSRAFEWCTSLTQIDLAEGANIGSYTFYRCGKIESLILKNATVNSYSFEYCMNLKDVTFEGKSFTVMNKAFDGCTAFHKLTLKSDVVGSTNMNFTSCEYLDTVITYAITPPTVAGFASEVYENATLYVPTSSINLYKEADIWKEFGTIKTIEDTPMESITTNANGIISYVASSSLDFTNVEGLTAYVATEVSSTTVTLEKAAILKAGDAVVLKGSPSTTYSVPVTIVSPASWSKNLFLASDGTYTVADGDYAYALNTTGQFQRIGAGVTIPSGKAYLKLDESVSTKLSLNFVGETVTGIKAIRNENVVNDNVLYNLAGQRVKASTKGFVIKNGHKYFVK